MVRVVSCNLPNLRDYCDEGVADGVDYSEMDLTPQQLKARKRQRTHSRLEPKKQATVIDFGEEL